MAIRLTKPRPKKPRCKCDHERSLHHDGACWDGWSFVGGAETFPCDCTRYRPQKGANRVAKRKDYKRGRGYENDVADALGGVRLGGVAEIDVVIYDPHEGGGAELLAIECEETKTAHLSKARVRKHEQAERLARGRKGAPLPAYAFRRKLGPGVESEDWVLMKRRNLAKLLERLEGE